MSVADTCVGTPFKRKLLLYVETRCVDYRGELDPRRLNLDEIVILQDWDGEGFVDFRIPAFVVRLSDCAWKAAHKLRRERAARNALIPAAASS